MSRLPTFSPVRDIVRTGVRKFRERNQSPGIQPGDVYECDEDYRIYFDAPGVNEADVHIRYVDDSVHVRMERFRPPRIGFSLVTSGRRMSFDGRVDLPADTSIDPDMAGATLRSDGTLVIELPKGDASIASDAESVSASSD